MIGRIHGFLAVAACAAGVICCGGSNDEVPPVNADPAASEPPPRDEASNSPGAPSAPATPAPPAPPSEDAGPGLMFDAVAPAPEPAKGWLVDDANMLVSFPLATPAMVTATAIAGLPANEKIVGIDIRPADGKIYALGTSSRIYTIDRKTAAATAVSQQAFTPALAGQAWGFDFNPVVDKIRVVTEFDQNLRIDPTTGAVVGNTADGMLGFAADDPNAGQSPALVGAAYTNSVKPAPTSTMLYAIDATRDLLVKIPTPNDGKVMTVGSLDLIVADDALGFDIRGSEATKLEAFAAMRVGEKNGFYSIDLATGKATLVAEIAHAAPLHGLAVDP